MNLKRVVVTGLGAITPIGNNLHDFWQALTMGVSGTGPITRFDTDGFRCKIAAEVKDFNAVHYFDKKECNRIDLFAQYGIVAAEEAIHNSGIKASVPSDRIGVVWGAGLGGVQTLQSEIGSFMCGDGTPHFSPFFIPKVIVDICAGHISIRNGFRGPNYATVAACASSAMAISSAFDLIRLDKADVIVAGGSEAAINASSIGGFSSMHALSTRNDDPATASRPFDKDRDGFVLGEGAGTIILEELECAKARGAHIYAELTGVGLSADAFHITASHPEGAGALRAMKNAVEDSGMQLCDVDHINTHGTSTPIGDRSEPLAVKNLFGDHAERIALNAPKSMMGHLLGAAGCVEAIATILAIEQSIIPPTINHFTDDPEIVPLDYTFHRATHRSIDFALSNAFGFGGHNVCLAFRKYNG